MLYILLQLRAEAAMELFNKPARLFVLDASLCLFKYLRDSICYGVIESAMKRWWCGQADWVRNGGEEMALPIYFYFFTHTASMYTE